MPDLKVYVNADPNAPQGKPKYYSAAQVEELQTELAEAKAAVEAANRRTTEAMATYQQQYPGQLQFVYGTPNHEKPFLVRSIWNDGQFTYIKADAPELPALYEVKDAQAGAGELPGPERHLHRAEGAGPRLPGARQGTLRVRATRAVSDERHRRASRQSFGCRSSTGADGCASTWHSDVGHARRGRWNDRDHPVRGPARACRQGCRHPSTSRTEPRTRSRLSRTAQGARRARSPRGTQRGSPGCAC